MRNSSFLYFISVNVYFISGNNFFMNLVLVNDNNL